MDVDTSRKPLVQSLPTCVEYGLVWACANQDRTTPKPIAPAVVENVDWFFMTDTVKCEIAEAAENFLDGFHTHFVHAGWIRRDKKRQFVKAEVRKLPDGIEARYTGEGLQSGFTSGLLEGSRTESSGRFRLPCVAEIEYRGKRGLNLLITVWLTPETKGHLRIHARVATRCGFSPAWLKRACLRRLFSVILRQDKTILEQTRVNISGFDKSGLQAPLLDTPLDLLGPTIRHLLAGRAISDSVERDLICLI